jgi:hypothetical protein
MNSSQSHLYGQMISSMRIFKQSLNDNVKEQKELASYVKSNIDRFEVKLRRYKPKNQEIVVKRGKFKLVG